MRLPRELIKAGIAGIGTCVPDRVLANAELEKILVDTTGEWIFYSTGIRKRRIASPEQATSDMAVVAAERALADAGITVEEVNLFIVATSSPDTLSPAAFCLVQDRLGAKNAGGVPGIKCRF